MLSRDKIAAVCVFAGLLGAAAWRTFVLPSWLASTEDEYRTKLQSIRPEDGISADEAEAITEVYYSAYMGHCGAPMHPQSFGSTWRASLRFGMLGKPSGEWIEVNATTGGVSASRGPSFSTFSSFRRHVLWGLGWRRT